MDNNIGELQQKERFSLSFQVFCVTLEQDFNMVLFVLFRAARCGLYELLYF